MASFWQSTMEYTIKIVSILQLLPVYLVILTVILNSKMSCWICSRGIFHTFISTLNIFLQWSSLVAPLPQPATSLNGSWLVSWLQIFSLAKDQIISWHTKDIMSMKEAVELKAHCNKHNWVVIVTVQGSFQIAFLWKPWEYLLQNTEEHNV